MTKQIASNKLIFFWCKNKKIQSLKLKMDKKNFPVNKPKLTESIEYDSLTNKTTHEQIVLYFYIKSNQYIYI